jgi:hypothetical protein
MKQVAFCLGIIEGQAEKQRAKRLLRILQEILGK